MAVFVSNNSGNVELNAAALSNSSVLFSDRKGKSVVKFEVGVILSVREWEFSVGLPVKFSASLSLLSA